MTTSTALDLRTALLELTPAQQTAAETLATGATQTTAAEAAGVHRETVTRWSGHHPAFRAALALYRAALADEHAATAQRIRSRALAVVEAQLDEADLPTALAVLRAVPAPPTETVAPTSAAAILDADTNRTRAHLPPLPINYRDPLDMFTRPDDAERAATVTVERLAIAAGITEGAT